MGDEVIDQLKANLPATHVAIPFPVAVNGLLVILDSIALVPLACGQPSQL